MFAAPLLSGALIHRSLFPVFLELSKYMIFKCIVYEEYGRTLKSVLADGQLLPLPVRQVRCVIWQMFLAVECECPVRSSISRVYPSKDLHASGIVHASIAPGNIVFAVDQGIRIIDFNRTGQFVEKVRSLMLI